MKRKEAIQKGIDEVTLQGQKSQAELQQELLQKRKDDAKPALLKRIGAGLLDFIFTAAVAGGLFALAYYCILPSVGYQGSVQFMLDTYENSGLYVKQENALGYDQLTLHYDENKTPEQNYDEPITNFYNTNPRAVKNNEIANYINRKLESRYYVLNEQNECVRKEGIVEELAKTYLEKEYKIAVNYLFGDPEVSSAVKVITYSIPISVLIVAVISCSIFYFLIPLIDKKRSTLGYIIFRIIPVNSEDLTLASKKKIALRSAMFVFINYISLITLGLFLGVTSFSFIPFFINTVSICLSHSNSGLHDFGTKIIVINESRSSAMAALKQVSGGK